MIIVPMIIQWLYNNWKWNLYVNNLLKTTEYELVKMVYMNLYVVKEL